MGSDFVLELPKQLTSVGFAGLLWGECSRVAGNRWGFSPWSLEGKKLGTASNSLGNFYLPPRSLAGQGGATAGWSPAKQLAI